MTRIQDLIDGLQLAIGGRPVSYNTRSAAWDVYEGYVFGLVVRAGVASGGGVTFEDVDGNSATRLLFRTSPGMLYSRAGPYTHAVLSLPDCDPLEIHVGVRVQGRSRVLHECDVLVLPAAEADICRSKSVAPRGSRALLAVECKYYGTHLSLYLARGFQGLHNDLGLKHPFFVANINAPRVERYLSYHNRRWGHGVIPQSQEEAFFIGAAREAFKQHIAVRGVVAP
jgi:hypothetical protein